MGSFVSFYLLNCAGMCGSVNSQAAKFARSLVKYVFYSPLCTSLYFAFSSISYSLFPLLLGKIQHPSPWLAWEPKQPYFPSNFLALSCFQWRILARRSSLSLRRAWLLTVSSNTYIPSVLFNSAQNCSELVTRAMMEFTSFTPNLRT